MNAFKVAALAAVASVAMGSAALAQDDTGPSVSFNVGAASDYVFRGVSQTDENPQIFGGVDFTSDIFYAGIWASNVDFNDETDAEVDFYAGVKPTLGPVSMDLGLIYYAYINEPSGAEYNYLEAKVAGSVPLGPATLGAALYYSPDFFGGADDDEAFYYELNGSAPLGEKLSLTGAVGVQEVDGLDEYTTWNLGVGYALTDSFGLDLRYWDTSEHDWGDIYESRVVLGLKATF